MPRGSTTKAKAPSGLKQPRKKSKIKRPEGWNHITGYRKLLVATSKCSKCDQKPSHIDPPVPHRQCVKCGEKICWRCEKEAGGPSHKSVYCNVSDPLPDDCSDTTTSTTNSKHIVYSFWGDQPNISGNVERKDSYTLSPVDSSDHIPGDDGTALTGKLLAEQVNDDESSGGEQLPRRKNAGKLGRSKTQHISGKEARRKTQPTVLDEPTYHGRKTPMIATDTASMSFIPGVSSPAWYALTTSERERYMARQKLLTGLGIWIEPDYAPPGYSPGSAQRSLINATTPQLQEYAHKKNEWAFHAANSIGRSYVDNPITPRLSAYQINYARPGASNYTYQPQWGYLYGGYPRYDQYMCLNPPMTNWSGAFHQPWIRAESSWEHAQGHETSQSPYPTKRFGKATKADYSDTGDEDKPLSGILGDQPHGRRQKRTNLRSRISGSEQKQRKRSDANHITMEEVSALPAEGHCHAAHDVVTEMASKTAPATASALKSSVDGAEVLTSRSFGRGRGRLGPLHKDVAYISDDQSQSPKPEHPKQQPRVSRILRSAQVGFDSQDHDLSSPLSSLSSPWSSLYQFPTSDIRSTLGRHKEEPALHSQQKNQGAERLDREDAIDEY